jgi:hypothetical protein
MFMCCNDCGFFMTGKFPNGSKCANMIPPEARLELTAGMN